MWRALIAGIVFGHPSMESLVRELNRNSSLLALCGFCPIPVQRRVRYGIEPGGGGAEVKIINLPPPRSPAPRSFNFSRFLLNVVKLEQRRGLVSGMIEQMRGELMELLPDFGKNLGYDGKAMESHSTGHKSRGTGETSDPEADWGAHKYSGVDSNGKAWTKIKTWFGYRLHVIADTRYELPVAFTLTKASVSEGKELDRMTDVLFAKDPELKNRCGYLCADKGLDSAELKKKLWDDYRTRPHYRQQGALETGEAGSELC